MPRSDALFSLANAPRAAYMPLSCVFNKPPALNVLGSGAPNGGPNRCQETFALRGDCLLGHR